LGKKGVGNERCEEKNREFFHVALNLVVCGFVKMAVERPGFPHYYLQGGVVWLNAR
jgi:hypothetical protein